MPGCRQAWRTGSPSDGSPRPLLRGVGGANRGSGIGIGDRGSGIGDQGFEDRWLPPSEPQNFRRGHGKIHHGVGAHEDARRDSEGVARGSIVSVQVLFRDRCWGRWSGAGLFVRRGTESRAKRGPTTADRDPTSRFSPCVSVPPCPRSEFRSVLHNPGFGTRRQVASAAQINRHRETARYRRQTAVGPRNARWRGRGSLYAGQ